MLILSRKPNEAITIGDDVVIRVLSISGKQVRIGIDAPDTIKVHREEIYEKLAGTESDVYSESKENTEPGESSDDSDGNK